MKYTIGEIARAVSGTVHGDAQTTVCGVCIDTRKLVPGQLFVALKGEGDGHAYLDEAIGKQAAALLVEKNTGSIRSKSPSACIRSINTEPTMPRQPTKPTKLPTFCAIFNPKQR